MPTVVERQRKVLKLKRRIIYIFVSTQGHSKIRKHWNFQSLRKKIK